MVQASPPSPLREEDYDAIETAVMETSRGRWFLSEFARRNRSADTDMLLGAIQKLEKSMARERKVPQIERIQLDLADMQEAILRTKQEIAQIKHESDDGDRFTEASNELDAIINQTEGATENILGNTEKIQELAWTLREQGVDEKVCDDIDALTTEIFMACSFQDLTGQRTQKVVLVLRYLESRINEMMNIWGVEVDEMDVERAPINPDETRPDAHLLNGPQSADKATQQDSIDALMDVAATGGTDMADQVIDAIEFDSIDTGDADETNDVGDAGETEETAAADMFATGDGEADVFAAPEAAAAPADVAADAMTADEIDTSEADVFAGIDAGAALAQMVSEDDEMTAEEAAALAEAAKDVAEDDVAEDAVSENAGAPDAMEAAEASEEGDVFAAVETDVIVDDIDMMDEGSEASDDSALEAEIEEAKADALFEEMDGGSVDTDEDETDPMSGLSSGERMALFS